MTACSSTGVLWPEGQALPRFAAPTDLEVLDLTQASAADVLLATTAQGVVNRSRPQVWLLRDAEEGSQTWLDTLALPGTPVVGVEDLITRHRREIRGAVVADPAVPATRNVATTLAGLEDAVVAEPTVAQRLNLPVLADLRGRFAHDDAAYRWSVDRLWPRTTHRMLVGLDHGNPGFLRDYAVANRALVLWLNPGRRKDRALLKRVLAQMPANSPYLGWWPGATGENDGTELASRHGVYVVAADFSLNLTVFGGVRQVTGAATQTAPTPPLQDRTYVTFTMTDGDNLQYCQHAMRRIWDTPERGQAPLNWTVSPLLHDAAPAILAYYQRTATPNDLLIVGPSGAGYAYPKVWPHRDFPAFTQQTGQYARHLGQPVVNVLNRVAGKDRDLSLRHVAAYVRDVQPAGILQHWTSRHAISMVAGLPVATSQLVSNPTECHSVLARAASAPSRPGPRFVSIGTLAWSMTPADVATVIEELDDRYRVVRADQFFQLVRLASGFQSATAGRESRRSRQWSPISWIWRKRPSA
jgi:GxGYxYP putative glycoside hydrolase C-terminal domain/GxGYxYP third domain/GxGYxYP_N second domain/GxGYxYP_N 1st domain